MMRSLMLSMLAFAWPVCAQPVDFSALGRYGDACVKLKAAIRTDAGKALGKDGHVIDWISEYNGNIPACWDARDAIREVKRVG